MKKFLSLYNIGSFTAFANRGVFVRMEVKEWKNWFERVRKKTNTLFAGLGSVRIVKNCDRGVESAVRGRSPEGSIFKTEFQYLVK